MTKFQCPNSNAGSSLGNWPLASAARGSASRSASEPRSASLPAGCLNLIARAAAQRAAGRSFGRWRPRPAALRAAARANQDKHPFQPNASTFSHALRLGEPRAVPLVIGHWGLVILWSLVIGHWSLPSL